MPDPIPGRGEVLIDVAACGVCRTDLHIADGELSDPKLPLVLGHQIVGTVAAAGEGVELVPGVRIGVPWLAVSADISLWKALDLGFVPFIPGGILKAALAAGLLPTAWAFANRK